MCLATAPFGGPGGPPSAAPGAAEGGPLQDTIKTIGTHAVGPLQDSTLMAS